MPLPSMAADAVTPLRKSISRNDKVPLRGKSPGTTHSPKPRPPSSAATDTPKDPPNDDDTPPDPRPLRINIAYAINHSSRDIVVECAEKLKWPVCTARASQKDHLYYICCRYDMQTVMSLVKGRAARVSRFPGMLELCGKYGSARLALLYDKLWRGAAAFMPKTWLLPDDATEAMLYLPHKTAKISKCLIVKPDSGAKGDGIFLCCTRGELMQKSRCRGVAQAYIDDPLLLNGLKFDFRLYVLLTSINPIRAYLCKAGLVRFCTEPYVHPAEDDTFSACAHLTNYAINMKSDQFAAASEDCEEATKRTLRTVLRQLEEAYPNRFSAAEFWKQAENIVAISLAMLQLPLQQAYDRFWGPKASPNKCFHLLGYDFLMDADFRLFLLELNNAPSLYLHEVQFTDLVPAETPEDPLLASRRNYSGGECFCMDVPHIHVRSPVDSEVKELVVGGAMQILRQEIMSSTVPSETWGPIEDIYSSISMDDCGPRVQDVLSLNCSLWAAFNALSATSTVSRSSVRRSLGLTSVTETAHLDIALSNVRRVTCIADFFQVALQLAAWLASLDPTFEAENPVHGQLEVYLHRLIAAFCPDLVV